MGPGQSAIVRFGVVLFLLYNLTVRVLISTRDLVVVVVHPHHQSHAEHHGQDAEGGHCEQDLQYVGVHEDLIAQDVDHQLDILSHQPAVQPSNELIFRVQDGAETR